MINQRVKGAGKPNKRNGGMTMMSRMCCNMCDKRSMSARASIGESRARKSVARPAAKNQGWRR